MRNSVGEVAHIGKERDPAISECFLSSKMVTPPLVLPSLLRSETNKCNKGMQSCTVHEQRCWSSDMLLVMDVRNSTSLPTDPVVPLKVTLVGPLDVLSLGTKHYLMVKTLSKA